MTSQPDNAADVLLVPPRPTLDALTGLRALAAGWVVLTHSDWILFSLFPGAVAANWWLESGNLGVDIFFTLSGFIIAYNYADRFSKFNGRMYGDFLILRVARIYPVHAVTIILLAGPLALFGVFTGTNLLLTDQTGALDFAANLAMLQGIPGVAQLNLPAWSITYEFLAYLAFPALALLAPIVNSARRGLLGALALTGVGATVLILLGPAEVGSLSDAISPLIRIVVGFTAGVLVYFGWRCVPSDVLARTSGRVSATAVVAIIAIGIISPPDSHLRYVALPFVALLIGALASGGGVMGRFLTVRVMEWGGRISYSVYMTHVFVVIVLVRAKNALITDEALAELPVVARILILVGYFAIVIAGGALCYYVVEEPCRKLIRGLLRQSELRRQRRQAAEELESRTSPSAP